jgi:hypothetical protein
VIDQRPGALHRLFLRRLIREIHLNLRLFFHVSWVGYGRDFTGILLVRTLEDVHDHLADRGLPLTAF